MQQLPNSVKHAIGIAPNKSVRVVTPEGEHRVLREGDQPAPDPNVQQIADLIKRAVDLDEQLRANMAMMNTIARDIREGQDQLKGALADMTAAMSSVVEGQSRVVASAESLERAFYAPVIPVYDDSGKIKAAQRIRR